MVIVDDDIVEEFLAELDVVKINLAFLVNGSIFVATINFFLCLFSYHIFRVFCFILLMGFPFLFCFTVGNITTSSDHISRYAEQCRRPNQQNENGACCFTG